MCRVGLSILYFIDYIDSDVRQSRLALPSGIYHVTSRRDGREVIYEKEEE